MSEKPEAIIQRFYDEIFSVFSDGKMNIAAIDRHLADDFIAHDLPLALEGREDYKKFISMIAASFSDMNHINARDIFSCGDKVVARWSWSGKHTAEFMGIPATHRQITLKGIDIFCLADG